ncbi:hypothetical protein [Calidifontibacter indicus]|uniref:hypothetical protein n=1 Tax=Calidifontibacter indicus TaxID=419650 RepID=UPI003D72FBFA
MSVNPLPQIRAVQLFTPNALTTVIGVHFVGTAQPDFFGFTALTPAKRRLLCLGQRPTPMLTVSIGAHQMLRQLSAGFAGILSTEPGQRVVRDFLWALARLDGPQVMRIAHYLGRSAAGRTRPNPAPAPSAPSAPAKRPASDRERAVAFLTADSRAEDAGLVDDVCSRFARLSAREQVAVGQAIRAIIDAYSVLGRLTPQRRTRPGPDGLSPADDAAAAVDAALTRLAAALHEAQESDTSSLRALRLYAGQWAERPDDPLNLG